MRQLQNCKAYEEDGERYYWTMELELAMEQAGSEGMNWPSFDPHGLRLGSSDEAHQAQEASPSHQQSTDSEGPSLIGPLSLSPCMGPYPMPKPPDKHQPNYRTIVMIINVLSLSDK